MVHGLEDDAAGKCPVADDRHDVPRLLGPQQVVAAAQPQGRSHAAAGVAGEKQVVVALGRVRVAHQAPFGPHRLELVVPAGDHLMGIHLVAGVPDQAIAAEIEAGVQGQGQLHHPQIGSEVCRPAGNQSAQRLAHFVGQRGQLLVGQALKVLRATRSSKATCPSTIPFEDIPSQGLQPRRQSSEAGYRLTCRID